MEFAIKVLGVQEDGGWYAIAIDMNLSGYGENFDEALDDLKNAIEFQIKYAVNHGTLENIFVPAEKKYCDLYNKTVLQEIKHHYFTSKSTGNVKSKNFGKGCLIQDVFMSSINPNFSQQLIHT